MPQLHRLKVNVTIQGYVIYPSICDRSVSLKPFELVSFYLIEMFLIGGQCAEPMTQLQRLEVKATVQDIGFTLEFCVRSIPPEPFERFFIKVRANAYLIKAVCRAIDLTTQTIGQGTRCISCLFHISGTFEKIPLNFDQMFIWV